MDACDGAVRGSFEMERADPLAARDLKLLTAAPPCWQKTELRADVKGTYTTPFDADQIAVDAEIRSPSRRVVHVPAFFYQEYEATGETGWRIRSLRRKPEHTQR